MAISRIGTAQSGVATNGGNVTLTFDVVPAINDYVVVFGGHKARGSSYGPSTGGYTQLVFDDTTYASIGVGIWYKKLTAADTNVVCQGSADVADATAYTAIVYRGVHQSSPIDATTVKNTGSSSNPVGSSITTANDGSVVLCCAGMSSLDATAAVNSPTSFTQEAVAFGDDNNDLTLCLSSIVKATAGSQTVGAHSGWSPGDNWIVYSVALRQSTAAVIMDVTKGTYVVTGVGPGMKKGLKVVIAAGVYTVTGVGPGTRWNRVVQITKGIYTYTGIDVGKLNNRILAITAGAYTYAGQALNLVRGKGIQVVTGVYALTGVAVGKLRGYVVQVTKGVYTVTGVGPGRLLTLILRHTTGVYTYTGIGPALSKGLRVLVTAGAYVVTGVGPGKLQGYRVAITTGVYTYTGIAIGKLRGYRVQVTAGIYALTGIGPELKKGLRVIVAAGAYVVTGVGPGTRWNRVLQVTKGVYTLTGIGPAFRFYHMLVTTGVYTLSGKAVLFVQSARRMAVSAGSYIMTGMAVGFRAVERKYQTWGRMIRLDRERND